MNKIIKKQMLIYDNIHGYIEISPLAKQIIDTIEFQRLRQLHQTGALYLVFPTAVHSRFEHSIGTYYLTGKILENISIKQPEFRLTKKLIELIKIGGLCHDLGHCTLSHFFDDFVLKNLDFYNDLGDEKHHEFRSIILVKHIIKKYNIDLNDGEIKIIQDVIYPSKNSYESWDEKYKKGKFLLDIVCNNKNNIDVDKFDYISRDNFAIGLKLGFDYSRLIELARVIDDTICYPKKIMDDIVHLFLVRYRLYKQIYNHKTVISFEFIFASILIDYIKETKSLTKDDLKDPDKIIEWTDQIFYLIRIKKIRLDLFNRIFTRDGYPFIKEYKIPVESNFNKEEFLKKNNDIILFDSKIGFVSGNNKNPFDNIYYYKNEDYKIKYKANKFNISLFINDNKYQERFIKIYGKNKNDFKKLINKYNNIQSIC